MLSWLFDNLRPNAVLDQAWSSRSAGEAHAAAVQLAKKPTTHAPRGSFTLLRLLSRLPSPYAASRIPPSFARCALHGPALSLHRVR